MFDETTDVSNVAQLSVVPRYVYEGTSYERFIKFIDMSADKTADKFFQEAEKNH